MGSNGIRKKSLLSEGQPTPRQKARPQAGGQKPREQGTQKESDAEWSEKENTKVKIESKEEENKEEENKEEENKEEEEKQKSLTTYGEPESFYEDTLFAIDILEMRSWMSLRRHKRASQVLERRQNMPLLDLDDAWLWYELGVESLWKGDDEEGLNLEP